MRPYLLDVNVLLALAWPSHVHHLGCQKWFSQKRTSGFRTCPLTQIGFVRISCNSTFLKGAVQPPEAMELLREILALPEHEFWPDDIGLSAAQGAATTFAGHRQITDAYLLALAAAPEGTLATLDRAILHLAREKDRVEIPLLPEGVNER